MNLDKRVRLFVVLAVGFCTALIVADLVGVKLFEVHLGSLVAVMPVGLIAFRLLWLRSTGWWRWASRPSSMAPTPWSSACSG